MKDKQTHLGRINKNSINTEIPVRIILNLGQIRRDSHSDVVRSTRDVVRDLRVGIIAQIAQVAGRVVVQPDAVVAGELVEAAVGAALGVAVEGELHGGSGGQGGVLGDALVDVDAGVVALAPGCWCLC